MKSYYTYTENEVKSIIPFNKITHVEVLTTKDNESVSIFFGGDSEKKIYIDKVYAVEFWNQYEEWLNKQC